MKIPRPDQKFTLPRWADAIGQGDKWTQREFARRGIKSSGPVVVNGRTFPGYAYQDLPADLQVTIQANAKREMDGDITALVAREKPEWKPPFDLALVHPEELADAGRWMEALRPALERLSYYPAQVAEAAQQARDGAARVFSRQPSAKVIKARLDMVRLRARGSADYEKLSFYLPDSPRMQEAQPAETTGRFDDLRQRLESVPREKPVANRKNREARKEHDASVAAVWKCALEHYERLTTNGTEPRLARAQILDVLKTGWLAPNPEALRKQFEHRLANGAEDRRKDNGGEDSELTRQIEALGWFIPVAKFFYFHLNRINAFSKIAAGSIPEAVLRTILLPETPKGWQAGPMLKGLLKVLEEHGFNDIPTCPSELRAAITARQRKRNAKLVPASIANQITVPNALIAFHRSPREASLTYLSAPGSQRRYRNADGDYVMMKPGDVFGADDSTPGIAVCVPTNQVHQESVRRFGVMLGRFQWIPFIDCASDKILSYDYVIRPRGSYRSEDIVSAAGTEVKTHGLPRVAFQFEGGTFNSKLVRQMIYMLGCKHWRTHSPHQKAIESVFNRIWTQLSVQFPHADMGRYRNENEANCRIYEDCKRGHKDPRRYFPTIELVLEVIEQEVKRHNARMIHSEQYGSWVPDDVFASAVAADPLRQFDRSMEWIFSPFSVERKVRGNLVKCSVPMFEDFSVPFEFGADWLPLHRGKRVRLHFNPREPRCNAKVVLLEPHGQYKAGEVLGDAELIGATAEHIKMILGWANVDQRAGIITRQTTANFVRRESRGIGAEGRIEYSKSEQHNGLGVGTILESGKPLAESKTPATEQEGSEEWLSNRLTDDEDRDRRIYEMERDYILNWQLREGSSPSCVTRAEAIVREYLDSHPEEARLEKQRGELEKLMKY